MRDGSAGRDRRDDAELGQKKLKQPSFAAAVDRDDVRRGAEGLGDFDDHLARVIAAMEERAEELGLAPREDAEWEASA
jgi:predicted hydrolase (HD superfamily)